MFFSDYKLTRDLLYFFLARSVRELAWRSGSVWDFHATARGSIPTAGVKTELHVLHKGQ